MLSMLYVDMLAKHRYAYMKNASTASAMLLTHPFSLALLGVITCSCQHISSRLKGGSLTNFAFHPNLIYDLLFYLL